MIIRRRKTFAPPTKGSQPWLAVLADINATAVLLTPLARAVVALGLELPSYK